jgi:hypothetical protein
MITIANYSTEKKNIDWSKLPKNVSELKNDVEEIMEFYNDDADIKETVDLFLKKLNDNSSGGTSKIKEIAKKSPNVIIAKAPPVKFKEDNQSIHDSIFKFLKGFNVNEVKEYSQFPNKYGNNVSDFTVVYYESEFEKNVQVFKIEYDTKRVFIPNMGYFSYKNLNDIKNIIKRKAEFVKTKSIDKPKEEKELARPSTRSQIAATKYFKKFVPKHQQKALVQVNSEELDSVIADVDKQLSHLSKRQDVKAKDAIVHAHYFYGGSDWFIIDAAREGELFGYAILNGDSQMSELGYMSLDEIVNQGRIELDFYWKKKTLAEALYKADPDYFENPAAGTDKKKEPTKTPPAKKTTKKVEKTVDVKEVAHYSKDYTLIRRFYNLVSKKEVVPFRTIRLIFMAFNKAAVERTVRKKDESAALFQKVNEKVVKLYNEVKDEKDDADIYFKDTKLLKEMETFVKEAKVNPAVRLLKSFISIQGFKPDTKRAGNLLKRIDSAIDKNRVTKSNRLFEQLISAQKALKKYLDKPSEKIEANVYGLSAPRNLCTNRIKCDGLRNDGKLRKGYKFLIDGIVAKVKTSSKKKTGSNTRKKKVNVKKKKGLGQPLVLDAGKPPYNPVFDLDAAESNRDATAAALGLPVVEPETVMPPAVPVKRAVPASTAKKNGLVKKMSSVGTTKHAFYRSHGDLSRFMGGVEIKPVESIVTTLDAPQGAMKTRLFFQIMNHYASLGYKVLFVSLEEHPDSALFKNKRDQYINPQVQDNIDTVGELPNGFKDFKAMVPDYDIIFVDSWGKLTKNDRNTDLDNDVRKAFNGKWFFIIYQRTSSGSMRGGAASQFDGDMIMKIEKDDADYKNNYAYWNKNRYEREANMQYNIFHQRIHNEAMEAETAPNGVLML